MSYALAIDIGASSGRHIVGWWEQGQLCTREVFRFPNAVKEEQGHLVWDIEALEQNVRQGIALAKEAFPQIRSLSIDTWGVDYVLLKQDKPVLPAYAYRDSRTEEVIDLVHEKIPFATLYRHTGCQFQPFTSVYQLYHDLLHGRLEGVTDMLMIPEYLMYRLCGVKAREYTIGTTTGLVNAATGKFDPALTDALGLPRQLFGQLQQPGTVIGKFSDMDVVLCPCHDTAAAVVGIPMEGNHPYISSGTWSLLGVKTDKPITDEGSMQANYSNEGGVGYNRYQKNIMGMWLVNRLQKELCPELAFPRIVELAQESSCQLLVDANDAAFLSPKSMKEAFDRATGGQLKQVGDYFRCAYRSLAQSYRQAIDQLESNTGCRYEKLYIVGGGAKNAFLNRLTAEATGKEVVALPIEATALGNLMLQLR